MYDWNIQPGNLELLWGFRWAQWRREYDPLAFEYPSDIFRERKRFQSRPNLQQKLVLRKLLEKSKSRIRKWFRISKWLVRFLGRIESKLLLEAYDEAKRHSRGWNLQRPRVECRKLGSSWQKLSNFLLKETFSICVPVDR